MEYKGFYLEEINYIAPNFISALFVAGIVRKTIAPIGLYMTMVKDIPCQYRFEGYGTTKESAMNTAKQMIDDFLQGSPNIYDLFSKS